jgi:hypothetical protein
MKLAMFLGLFFVACGDDKSTGPNDSELEDFAEFINWGKGIAGFSAPTSAEGDETPPSDGDDTGSWGDGDDGVCVDPDMTDCFEISEADAWECEDMGWIFYGGYSCSDIGFRK